MGYIFILIDDYLPNIGLIGFIKKGKKLPMRHARLVLGQMSGMKKVNYLKIVDFCIFGNLRIS